MAHSILEVARELIDDADAKAAYADDPDGFLAARGLDTLTAGELEEAVGFVAESMPAPVARQLVAPPDPVGDSLPLARVAAATTMEAAVVEAEPGMVDLTALVDPSGQLDLPTDGIADVTAIEAAVAGEAEEPEEAMSEDDEDAPPPTDADPAAADGDDIGFGTGAPDQSRESDESDEEVETDDAAVHLEPEDPASAQAQPAFDHDDDSSAALDQPQTGPGKDDEPPEDDFEDVIV